VSLSHRLPPAHGPDEFMPSQRLFPPPWSIKRTSDGHFRVLGASGLTLAFVYVRNEGIDDDGLTDGEASRMALGIARLPQLLQNDDEDI